MRRLLLGGLPVITALALAIGTVGADRVAAQNRPQDRSKFSADAPGKTTTPPARSSPSKVIVNKPMPKNGAYYKGIFRN